MSIYINCMMLCTQSLEDFFRHKVYYIAKKQQKIVTNGVTNYLSKLLFKMSRLQMEYKTRPSFVDTLAKIEELPHHERLRQYRQTADSALYYAGFFADNIRTKLDYNFYCDFGSEFYLRVAHSSREQIFSHLSKSFKSFAEILEEMGEENQILDSKGSIRLYEKWSRDYNQRLERFLIEHGIIPRRETKE